MSVGRQYNQATMRKTAGSNTNAGLNLGAEVLLFTDGACSGNPGPGGWAFILRHPQTGKTSRRIWRGAPDDEQPHGVAGRYRGTEPAETTDPRPRRDGQQLRSAGTVGVDAQVESGQTGRRKTSSGYEPVKNVDLWQELDHLANKHRPVI